MKWAIALVSVAVMVCGCMSSTSDEQSGPVLSGEPELQGCNKIENTIDRENCYLDTAVEASKASLCESISADNLYNLCIHQLARKTKDGTLCQNIRQDDWRYQKCISSATT